MKCRICSLATQHVFDLQSQRHNVTVPVFRCERCDAFYSSGGPVNYADVDLTGYYMEHASSISQRYQRFFLYMETLLSPGRFLDIGAGMGFSLEVSEGRGWTSEGLEPNRTLAQHATHRGLKVVNGYLDGSQQGEFDLVLIDNVLEHVPDPVTFLHHAGRLLSRSGMMVIAIPPMDWLRKGLASFRYVRDRVTRPQLNIFGEVDEHLNMLSRRAMKALAGRANLQVLPNRFHHSPVYDNVWIRGLGLDDGYYFIKLR